MKKYERIPFCKAGLKLALQIAQTGVYNLVQQDMEASASI